MPSYVLNVQAMHPQVNIITYGVKNHSKKHQLPPADIRVNCQVLENPPMWIYAMDGTSKPVQQDMMRQIKWHPKLFKWFQNVLDNSTAWARYGIANDTVPTIAFFCYGGRHRSVATSELVGRYLTNNGFVVNVTHLDLNKKGWKL